MLDFGRDIRNANDPLVKQALEAAGHIGTAFEPMSARSLFDKRRKRDSAVDKTLPFFGVTPAPAEVQRGR